MDYKYIEQLLDRYWQCETSLEEEQILRAFFQQNDIPAEMSQYKPLFTYVNEEKQTDVLGEDFDEKMLSLIGEEPKAKVISIRQRLMPLFRAAAVVAIVLTLGNALQVAFLPKEDASSVVATGIQKPSEGPSVAKADSTRMDSINRAMPQQPVVIVK